jgi:acyl carrier protein
MDDVASRCIDLLAEAKGIPASSISLDSTFESLDADSLDKINLSFAVEEAFGIEIPDDRLHELRTVGDMVRGVETLIAAKAAAMPAGSL